PALRPTPPRQDKLRRAHQTEPVVCDQAIEEVFCRLKDFRRIATRYDKLARNFDSALALAAVIAFWC
ncbi:IS5/IS1182 family transposase, partial [Methylobacterium sp. EM32]